MNIVLEELSSCVLFEEKISNKIGDELNIYLDKIEKSTFLLAHIRLSLYYLWIGNHIECEKHLSLAYLSNNSKVQFYCKMISLYISMFDMHRLPSTEIEASITSLQENLRNGLKKIRGELNREKIDIEIELYFLYGISADATLARQEKISFSEEGLLISNMLGCKFYKDMFKTQIIILKAQLGGSPDESIKSLFRQIETSSYTLASEWQIRNLAYLFHHLTNFKDAKKTLERGFSQFGATDSLLGAQQIVEVFSGRKIIENSDEILVGYKSRGKYKDVVNNVSRLSQADKIFLDKNNLTDYKNILNTVIEFYSESGKSTAQWVSSIQKWCCASAYLRLGRIRIAEQIIDEIQVQNDFSFEERILKLGVSLEVSFFPFSNLSINRILNEFAELFEDYKKSKYSSISGASDILFRWHPKAAIFLSLLPNTPIEFTKWHISIVDSKKNPHAYSRTLPAAFYEECVLRNFDFDTLAVSKFSYAPLNTRDQKRKLDFSTNWGDLTIPSPIFTVPYCVYLLKKIENQISETLISDLIRSKGLTTTFESTYSSSFLVKNIIELTQKLIQNQITVAQYEREVFDF
jgi:hypothetical protein